MIAQIKREAFSWAPIVSLAKDATLLIGFLILALNAGMWAGDHERIDIQQETAIRNNAESISALDEKGQARSLKLERLASEYQATLNEINRRLGQIERKLGN